MSAAPMTRPRYRPECPLLWRAPGLAQLGEGRLHVLLPLTTDLARWLLRLDGLQSLDEVLASFNVEGSSLADAERVLAAASMVGALDDASAMPESWRWLPAQEREAALADHAAALLAYGQTRFADEVIDRRHRTLVHIAAAPAPVRRTVLVDLLGGAMRSAGCTVVDHPDGAQLTVIVGSHPVVGAEVASFEVAQPAGAHLFVAIFGDRAIAGPLVVPGRTSCLRCAYLHTRDADPQWAGVSLQLQTAIDRLPLAPVDRLLATVIAGQAGRLVRAWIDRPHLPEHWRNIAYEARLPEIEIARESRAAHPLCACQWTDTGES